MCIYIYLFMYYTYVYLCSSGSVGSSSESRDVVFEDVVLDNSMLSSVKYHCN